ncbi:hypothetical protein IGI37_000719 [Enterococcus sp. AZ194]|uniref:hypothetical protein n=1 Tax=Enterococcus sp. AZ194 TaxID=2774629 RepID=UPI003F258C96
MKNKNFIPAIIGLVMIFVLQILSRGYWLLINGGVINGIVSESIFFETNILLIPIGFIVYPFVVLFIKYIKKFIRE